MGIYNVVGAAHRLDVATTTIHKQVQEGRLKAYVFDDEGELVPHQKRGRAGRTGQTLLFKEQDLDHSSAEDGDEEWLDTISACKRLGIDGLALRNAVLQGKLPAYTFNELGQLERRSLEDAQKIRVAIQAKHQRQYFINYMKTGHKGKQAMYFKAEDVEKYVPTPVGTPVRSDSGADTNQRYKDPQYQHDYYTRVVKPRRQREKQEQQVG